MSVHARVVCVGSGRAAHHPRHHYRLASALAAAGYDVVSMAQRDPGDGHVDAVPVRYLPERKGRAARMLSAPLTLLRALRERPQVLHVMSLDLLPWAVAAQRLGRIVVIYDSNEEYHTYMLHKDWIPERLRRPISKAVAWAEPWLAKRLDATTTALPATQERFIRAGVRSVLLVNYPPAATALSDPGNGLPAVYDILVGGSLWPEWIKTIAATAACLEETEDAGARWLVVGRNVGPQERELLESSLAERGVRDRFEVRYDAPFTDMARITASARVGLVVCSGDGIPQRIFEYMGRGMPFVAPDLPTTTPFVQGAALLARPDDPRSYAAALATLLREPDRGAELGRIGRERAHERFNWERESQKLLALYEDLLKTSRS